MTADENTLKCPLCQLFYNKKERCPRKLLCSHTLCTSCIAILIETQKRKCPVCLRPFLASSETQLPTDFSVYKKIAYKANDSETGDSKFHIQNSRLMHHEASRESTSTGTQNVESQSYDSTLLSPTFTMPFKYQLPLIANSPTGMERLPPYIAQPYVGLEGYDVVDAPKERIMVEDITQEDIQEIPPPAPIMHPLSPSVMASTPSYQVQHTELQETPAPQLRPVLHTNSSLRSTHDTQKLDIKAKFSQELPKPIKRSFNPLIPPVPAKRSTLSEQHVRNSVKKETYVSATSRLHLPPTDMSTDVSSNMDVCNTGPSENTFKKSSSSTMQSAKWQPLSTSSPLLRKRPTESYLSTQESIKTRTRHIPESTAIKYQQSTDQSVDDGSGQSKRHSKRPAPSPKSLPADSASPAQKPSNLSITEENKQSNTRSLISSLRSPQLQKLSTKPRAPNPKPLARNIPTIYSPLLYKASNDGSQKSGTLASHQSLSTDVAGTPKSNAKQKTPMPTAQEESENRDDVIGLSTSHDNYHTKTNITAAQKHQHENIYIGIYQADTEFNNDHKEVSSLSGIYKSVVAQSELPILQIPYKYQLSDKKGFVTENQTTPTQAYEHTSPTAIVAQVSITNRENSSSSETTDINKSEYSARVPTPPSPSALPVSSDEERNNLNHAKANDHTTENKMLKSKAKPGKYDSSADNLTVGPIPFKSYRGDAKDSTKTETGKRSDPMGTGHSQYLHRVQRGELQVGEVPSIQNGEAEIPNGHSGIPIASETTSSHYRALSQEHNTSAPSKFKNIADTSGQTTQEPKKRYLSPLPSRMPQVMSLDLENKKDISEKPLSKSEKTSVIKKTENKKDDHNKSREESKVTIEYEMIQVSTVVSSQDTDDNNSSDESLNEDKKSTKVEKITKKAKSMPVSNIPKYISDEKSSQISDSDDAQSSKIDLHMEAKLNMIHHHKPKTKKEKESLTRIRKSKSSIHHSKTQDQLPGDNTVSRKSKFPTKYYQDQVSDTKVTKSKGGDREHSDKKYKREHIQNSHSDAEELPPPNNASFYKSVRSDTAKGKHSTSASKIPNYTEEESRYQRKGQHSNITKSKLQTTAHNPHKTNETQDIKSKRKKEKADSKIQILYRRDDGSDTSDINVKLQRARHRLRSTLYEPKFASPSTEQKTKHDNGSSDPRRSKANDMTESDSSTENQIEDSYDLRNDEEKSDNQSNTSETFRGQGSSTENSESENEYTDSLEEVNINRKGMIMRYPSGSKPKHLQGKDKMEINHKGMLMRYPSKNKPRDLRSKDETLEKSSTSTISTKKLENSNGSETEYTDSLEEVNINKKGMIIRYPPGSKPQSLDEKDKMEINYKGMIMRYPSKNQPQNSKLKEESLERSATSTVPKKKHEKDHQKERVKYSNSARLQQRKKEDADVSDINKKLQRTRQRLKSTLGTGVPKEQPKAINKYWNQKKKESFSKTKNDSDDELLRSEIRYPHTRKHEKKTNTGKHERDPGKLERDPGKLERDYKSRQNKRDESFEKPLPSRSYDSLSDIYKYDERVPKRFYSQVNLKPSHERSSQSVRNPAYDEISDYSSEDEPQNRITNIQSAKSTSHKSKDAIMPKHLGTNEIVSVSSEDFPTDIYADFKPEKNNRDMTSDYISDEVNHRSSKRKNKKREDPNRSNFLKRSVTLTGSQYKPSFYYRPSSQVYTAELALVTNPEDEKAESNKVADLEKEVAKIGVGQCGTHGALLDLYCKTCELWACHECLDVVHRPPPEGHCQTLPADQAVAELKESHAELFEAKIATLGHFKEELQKLLSNCDSSIKEHETSIAQLSSRVLSQKMIVQGIENMRGLVQQKWKQVERWEDVLEANALRIGQSASSGAIADAMEKNKSNILVHVMQGMSTGVTENAPIKNTKSSHIW